MTDTTQQAQQPDRAMLVATREKMLSGLKGYETFLIQHGQQLHKSYPPDRIPEDIYQNLTCAVPLPLAMILYGLATTELLIKQAEVHNAS